MIELAVAGKASATVASERLAADVGRISQAIAEFDAERRLKCDYDEFCKGNRTIATASGVNAMILATFKSRTLAALRDPELDCPLRYLTTFLLTQEMTDVTVQLVKEFFGSFSTPPMRHSLEKRFRACADSMTKRSVFGVEGILRAPPVSSSPSSMSKSKQSNTHRRF